MKLVGIKRQFYLANANHFFSWYIQLKKFGLLIGKLSGVF